MADLVQMTFSFKGEPEQYRAMVDLSELLKRSRIKVTGEIETRQPDGAWKVQLGPLDAYDNDN